MQLDELSAASSYSYANDYDRRVRPDEGRRR
jgi:hypothetical protein